MILGDVTQHYVFETNVQKSLGFHGDNRDGTAKRESGYHKDKSTGLWGMPLSMKTP